MNAKFKRAIVIDFEYEAPRGDLPIPLCMVAHELDENLEHVRTIRLWRGEFGPQPPFDIGDDTVVVAYTAWAELTCFMVLGWRFPKHIFDLHTAFLAASNVLSPYEPDEKRIKDRKRLVDACKLYGLNGWEQISKESIAKDIGEGRWRDHGQPVVLQYCEEDVRMEVLLLRAELRGRVGRFGGLAPVNTDLVLHWSNYSGKAVAQIQARGMPIDMPLWNLVQENKAAVIADLIRRFDPSFGSAVQVHTIEGEFSYERFGHWLTEIGVTEWPRLASGQLQTDSKAWDLMSYVPGIENLHALRDSLRVIVNANLPIGRDGRNRPSLFPFGTKTGRNAHTRSLFNAHAGMRGLMVFPPDKIGCYLDWRTQEIGVAAALSGDPALLEAYRGGDVYYAFARDCGLTQDSDPRRWARDHPDQRQRMKALALAITYGMSVASLAQSLKRHPLVASHLIEKHRRTYPRFWAWRDERVQVAMLERQIESAFGWPLHLTSSPNKRTLYNFPMQSTGAEMLRLASCRLCDASLTPIMLVHDGILFELDDEEEVRHAIEIMKGAGRDVCGGFEIGVDIDQPPKFELGRPFVRGARYADKRELAKTMWATIMGTLENIGAVQRAA
jgi:DNA polymerase I